MNSDSAYHLSEKQLLLAVVDETRLPLLLQQHLSVCRRCREEKGKIEQTFSRIGETAKRFAPFPVKQPTVPSVTPQKAVWRPALAMALTTALVIAAVWWAFVSTSPPESVPINNYTFEMWEDEQFMAEISFLTENALPSEYMEMITEPDLDTQDDFLQYIVPSTDTQPVSHDWKIKGGTLC